ncbi:hypothetical protein B0T25DRAFT_537128 [Lasiosphaeria hispida]|uniref:Uncharacterized protein n=1 Tax=Lasiosphaeria hispida TaxID=260671 RepID=A0AAJ0MFE1_9PEZI|nr:hypothetical protein B0T25DRAFT_537128 [Lasiosphaeria hispida]
MTEPILSLSPATACLIGLAILHLSLALPMPHRASAPTTTRPAPPENRTTPLKAASHLLCTLVPGGETQLFVTLRQQLPKHSPLSLPYGTAVRA